MTLAPVLDPPVQDESELTRNPRLFDVGGEAPNIVTTNFHGSAQGTPRLEKGKQYKFVVHATVDAVHFRDKTDAEGFPEKTTRAQKLKIDSLELADDQPSG